MKFSIFALLFILTSLGHAKGLDLDKSELRFGLNTTVVEAKDLKARVLGVNIDTFLEENIDESLKLFLDINVSMESGSNQSVGNIAEYAPTDSVSMSNGGLSYMALDSLTIKVGALNQRDLNAPLLVTATTFASVNERLEFGDFYINARQAVPSNHQLSKRVGTVDDETPSFLIETVGMKTGKDFRLTLEISQYNYKNLSSDTAKIGRELGNSVNGLGENSSYNYLFQGQHAYTSVGFNFIKNWDLKLSASYINNSKAPKKRKSGYTYELALEAYKNIFTVEQFRNESDTSPAYYNSKSYGHNNAKGSSVGMTHKGDEFDYQIKYTKVNRIEKNLLQTDMELLIFRMVKFYEI